MPTRRCLATLMAFCLGGCSIVLDWDREGTPCEASRRACVTPYACLDGKCTRFGSRRLGQTCEVDVHCANDNLCPAGMCARPCDMQTAFTQSTCTAGQYCGAFLSRAGDAYAITAGAPTYVSVCVDSAACTPGAACAQADHGICTSLSGARGVRACLPGCAVQVANGGSSNNCPLADYPVYCTPVGESGDQQLVCLNAGTAPLPLGERCNPTSSPCVAEGACIQGVCRRYCQLGAADAATAGCAASQACCPLQVNATLLVGYCAGACP